MPSKITIKNREKFDEEMNKLAKGNHYNEFINLFRRMKVRNDIDPENDNELLEGALLKKFIEDLKVNEESQALYEPPKENYKWPEELKASRDLPDSIFNQNRPEKLWYQLDPVGNGENTPTTGGTSTEVLHFLADIPKEIKNNFSMVIYMDMRTFPPNIRKNNQKAESSGHLDSGNTNQKIGDLVSFVKLYEDGTSNIIHKDDWYKSYSAKRFFEKNKIENGRRDTFIKSMIYFICQSRLSRSDSVLNMEMAKATNSEADKNSATMITLMCKDYQALSAAANDLGQFGTSITVVANSKCAFGNMLRSSSRLKRKIPKEFRNWSLNDIMEKKIPDENLTDFDAIEYIEVGETFKYPIICYTPLRNHKIDPTPSGKLSCKFWQITIIRKNIAGKDHYCELLISPERLGNISNLSNQLANNGNLFPKFGPLNYQIGLHYNFNKYNLYAVGTLNNYTQRAVITEFLLTNENKKFEGRTITVKIPVKNPEGETYTKNQTITAPRTHKNCYENGKYEKNITTIEALSVLGDKIWSCLEKSNCIMAIGQLPVIEAGMDIKIPAMENTGMRLAEVYNEGKIRDHTGYWTSEVSFERSRKKAGIKMIDLKERRGMNWKDIPDRENRDVVKKVLQKGYRENQSEIKEVKSILLNKDVVNELAINTERNIERNKDEYGQLKKINLKSQIRENLKDVISGNELLIKYKNPSKKKKQYYHTN